MRDDRGMWTLPDGGRFRITPNEVWLVLPDGKEIRLAYGRDDARALAMAIWAGVNPMGSGVG